MKRVHLRAVEISLAVLTAISVGSLEAQVTERRLNNADATFPEAFSTVRGLRELPDGRIMVADGLGQAVTIVDLVAGRADTIGRPGPGPAEYQQPDGLFAFPGDSTLLVDLGNGRLTVLGPDFSFGETTPIAQGAPGPGGGMSIRVPQGVDARGHIYYQQLGGVRRGGMMPDSAAIVRWDRSTGAVDTVAQVKLGERTRRTAGGGNNQSVEIRPVPMSPQDGWAVGPDGRVAVVRSVDYHVEWVRPDGSVIRGPANAYKPVRVRRADKEAWIERQRSSGLGVRVEVVNAQIRTAFTRGGGRRDGPNVDAYLWPEVMPAFQPGGIWVTPNGEVWVERYVEDDARLIFDVFDARGQMSKRVMLPKGRRLVGFGNGTVYLIRADEFDLQWLERYRR